MDRKQRNYEFLKSSVGLPMFKHLRVVDVKDGDTLTVITETQAGGTINGVAEEMVQLATDLQVNVIGSFNDQTIRITPDLVNNSIDYIGLQFSHNHMKAHHHITEE